MITAKQRIIPFETQMVAIVPRRMQRTQRPAIAIDDVARSAGTIGYELLTGLGRRYNREYIEN